MHGNRPAGVFLFFTALLLVASASAAVSGDRVVISHIEAAAAAETTASAPLHTASTMVRRLEDEVAQELSWAARLLAGDEIANNAVKYKGKPACLGPCPAGAPYSNGGHRDCQPIFQCGQ